MAVANASAALCELENVSPSPWAVLGLAEVLVALLLAFPLWLFGLLIGLLLPRGLRSDDASLPRRLSSTSARPPGLRSIKSRPLADDVVSAAEAADELTTPHAGRLLQQSVSSGHHWYITADDLARFRDEVQQVDGKMLSGKLGQDWTPIMDKEVPGVVRYVSYWRPTANGTTDYISVTIIPDATAQEVMEFCGDDACRARWDPMLASTWLLASRDTTAGEQLVVWLRSFPMGFLSDRLYSAIARKVFPDPRQPQNSLFAVSKVVRTPVAAAWAAEHFPGVVQTDNYFSAWRCRTITSPWPTADGAASQPACELLLFHHDELKVPEYLSRLAIKVGMWRFVQSMVDAASGWLEQRRAVKGIDPFADDPQAACRQQAPPLAGAAAEAAADALTTAGLAASADGHGSHAAWPSAAPALAAAPAGDADAGAGIGAWEEQQLLSPRRIFAVPTAPDLQSLASRPRAASGAASPALHAAQTASAGTSGLQRRTHSMEWEPSAAGLEDSATGTGRVQAGSTVFGRAAGRAGQQQQWQGVGGRVQAVSAGLASALRLLVSLPDRLPGLPGIARWVQHRANKALPAEPGSASSSAGLQQPLSSRPAVAAGRPAPLEAPPANIADVAAGVQSGKDQHLKSSRAGSRGPVKAAAGDAWQPSSADAPGRTSSNSRGGGRGGGIARAAVRCGVVVAAVCMVGLLARGRAGCRRGRNHKQQQQH